MACSLVSWAMGGLQAFHTKHVKLPHQIQLASAPERPLVLFRLKSQPAQPAFRPPHAPAQISESRGMICKCLAGAPCSL